MTSCAVALTENTPCYVERVQHIYKNVFITYIKSGPSAHVSTELVFQWIMIQSYQFKPASSQGLCFAVVLG